MARAGAVVRGRRRAGARLCLAVQSPDGVADVRHRRHVHGRGARPRRAGPGADRDALLLLRAPRDAGRLRQPHGHRRRRGDGRPPPSGPLVSRPAQRLQLRRAGVGGGDPCDVRRPGVGGGVLHRAELLRQRHRAREDRPGANDGARRPQSGHAPRARSRRAGSPHDGSPRPAVRRAVAGLRSVVSFDE